MPSKVCWLLVVLQFLLVNYQHAKQYPEVEATTCYHALQNTTDPILKTFLEKWIEEHHPPQQPTLMEVVKLSGSQSQHHVMILNSGLPRDTDWLYEVTYQNTRKRSTSPNKSELTTTPATSITTTDKNIGEIHNTANPAVSTSDSSLSSNSKEELEKVDSESAPATQDTNLDDEIVLQAIEVNKDYPDGKPVNLRYLEDNDCFLITDADLDRERGSNVASLPHQGTLKPTSPNCTFIKIFRKTSSKNVTE